MAKKSKAKAKKVGTKRPKVSVHETATKETLVTLHTRYELAKIRVGNTNAGFAQLLKEAVEFKNLNKDAFALSMKLMKFEPIRARRAWDDLEAYLDHLGFHQRKAADLFRDKAPKAKKKEGKRDSGGLVPLADAMAEALKNAKPKSEEPPPPNNVTQLRAAE